MSTTFFSHMEDEDFFEFSSAVIMQIPGDCLIDGVIPLGRGSGQEGDSRSPLPEMLFWARA